MLLTSLVLFCVFVLLPPSVIILVFFVFFNVFSFVFISLLFSFNIIKFGCKWRQKREGLQIKKNSYTRLITFENMATTVKPISKEWLASKFSLQCHPWIQCQGHENKGDDQKFKTPLTAKQISSPWEYHRHCRENSAEKMNADVRVWRVNRENLN